MYAEGKGLPRDHTEAGKWFRKAADQGDAKAQANLGVLYANGLGVPTDLILSCMSLDLAAAQGSEDARSARDKLVSHLTPEQIAEAQRMARDWRSRRRPPLPNDRIAITAEAYEAIAATLAALPKGIVGLGGCPEEC